VGWLKNNLLERSKRFAGSALDLEDCSAENRRGCGIPARSIRSAATVLANLRAAKLGVSDTDVGTPATILRKEPGETGFWRELLIEKGPVSDKSNADGLRRESQELIRFLDTTILRPLERNS
jgi:hypothetical protein